MGKGFVVTEVSYGLGQHRNALSIENYRNFLKYWYLDTAQFFIALATCKISICLFLLRLSQFDKLRHVLWYLMGFLIISHLILFFLVVLQCDPVHKAWDLGTPGRCFSPNSILAINIIQGGESVQRIVCASNSDIILTRSSFFFRYRFHMCCFSGSSAPQASDTATNLHRPMRTHGPWNHHWRHCSCADCHHVSDQIARYLLGWRAQCDDKNI